MQRTLLYMHSNGSHESVRAACLYMSHSSVFGPGNNCKAWPKHQAQVFRWARLLQSSGAVSPLENTRSRTGCGELDFAGGGSIGVSRATHGFRVAQPIEPHGLHRSYTETGSRRQVDESFSQSCSGLPPNLGHIEDGAGVPRILKLLCCGGVAGAVSRSMTAPIDRLKFLMQMHTASHLTVRQGWALMARERTFKAYFRGNCTNVAKNVPETAMKLTLNDRIKAMVVKDGHNITLSERLIVGAVSGAIAQAVIYPLEVIQTRLAATHGVYKGMLDAVGNLWRKEGWRAFYRGMTPCLIGIVPYASLDITSFEVMKEWLTERGDGLPAPHLLLACGMLSSSGAQMLAYPFGFIRTRMQMDGLSSTRYAGMLDCFRQVLQREGWRGLYKGFGMSLAKIAPAAGLSWFIFEESKSLLRC